MKPGAALKEAIERQLAQAEQKPEPRKFQQTKEAPQDEAMERFEILLTRSEKSAIRERSNIERCSMRRWIVDAIRVGLTGEPQFGTSEVEALTESNYQLRGVGRNLNQLTRRANEGKPVHVPVEQAKALSDRIDKHFKVVTAAVRASLERWNLK
ncbi:plasmid mobilization relaxosome protein MobC [Lysobacter maris]|uniref:Plasmid mobilization relaxosome protein MobC n=1 Tax=Marilutibacter maris TaxID=1605891 RepID=A0A508B517_9GAMM|nr:plasmid mobilization relaxosome protein MobC [Lysobacter maris]KAB8198405.1 plasmid mobilization relaxosome protein MobC [Lysobacter maris]